MCTHSYRFHAPFAGMPLVLAESLNAGVKRPNVTCPVPSVVERIGLVCYTNGAAGKLGAAPCLSARIKLGSFQV